MKLKDFFSFKKFSWKNVLKTGVSAGKFISRKNVRFEDLLKRYAIYSPEQSTVTLAPTHRLFPEHQIRFLSSGIQARVYKMRDVDWVIKEGRWDLDFNLFGDTKLPLSAELSEKLLNVFSFTFLPTRSEILRQYKAYLKFIQYFGYFTDAKDYYHPNLELINNAQHNIRESLLFYKDELESYYHLKFDIKLDAILTSELKYHNFLPKEYLLMGQSISPENNNKDTFFIVQQYIKGTLLHDQDFHKLPDKVKKQMVLMIYLILLMNYQIHIVPDTRPRYPLFQISNWLMKTDNIIVNEDNVKFIDTRWFWDTKANFIKRGAVIPDLIINLSKNYINEILKDV